MTAQESKDWLDKLLVKNKLTRLILSVAALFGAIFVLSKAFDSTKTWYVKKYRWWQPVEIKLTSLRANVRLQEYIAKLGEPRMSISLKDKSATANVFQGKGYWVQAITDELQNVTRFTVTTCHEQMRPTWNIWDGAKEVEITLGHSKLAGADTIDAFGYDWFLGNTANTYAWAYNNGTNPTNYQSYHWGINDVCGYPSSFSNVDWATIGHSQDKYFENDMDIEDLESEFKKLTINSFGITGLGWLQEPEKFQYGVDRLWARTI